MLRLRLKREERSSGLAPPSVASGAEVEIANVYDDPLLEVVRLLREAANIEHALMVQYLYAAFSVKDKYDALIGIDLFPTSHTLIGVAIQEMQHLAKVNALLVDLKANPNLDRQDFPIRSDIYPFDLELEPLTLESCAKYVTAEAPLDALDPAGAGDQAERDFREAVSQKVGLNRVNHIGSLYGTVIARLRKAVEASPVILNDSDRWLDELEKIRGQGEEDHFLFFRSVFEGTHPALGGPAVWRDPSSDDYPSRPLPRNPTAYEGSDRSITDALARRLAVLANLHYWLVLGLLHQGHASSDSNLIGRAVSHMTGCLYPLGRMLADRGFGLPFDALALNFGPGMDRVATLGWLRRLVLEVQGHEADLSGDLGSNYKKSPAKITLQILGGIS